MIDLTARYEKTTAGSEAMTNRDLPLTPMCRRLLIMLNGRDSAGEVMERLGLSITNSADLGLLEKLQMMGLIQTCGGHNLSPAHSPPNTTQRKPDDSNIHQARAYILKVAGSLLADETHPVYQSTQRAQTRDDLLSCMSACRKLILTLSDESTARQFTQKVQDLLP